MFARLKQIIRQLWVLLPGSISFLVYVLTLAPAVVGFDSAELVTGAYSLGIVHPTGYPLFLLLGKLFTFLPVGNVAYRVNLMSAFFGALSVSLLSYFLFQLTGRRWTALFGGGVFAFMISFWQMAVVTEVYTLHVFFLSLEWVLLMRWKQSGQMRWLDFFVLAYTLSLANHVSGALFAPAFAWFILKHERVPVLLRRLPRFLILAIIGLSPYLYLPIRQMAQPDLDYVSSYYNIDMRTPSGLWWMITGQAYHFFAFSYDLAGYGREILGFFQLLVRNVTVIGVGFGLVGAIQMIRKRLTMHTTLLALFVLYGAFYIGYGVVDKATMFLPCFAVWAIWMGVGFDYLLEEGVAVIRRFLPELPRKALEHGFRTLSILFVSAFLFSNWNWADMSHAYAPEIFAEQVLLTIEDDAFIMGEWSSAVILEYYQTVEGVRPDVEIFNRSRFQVAQYYILLGEEGSENAAAEMVYLMEEAWISMASSDRPVYSVEYDPRLASSYEYQPVGNVFQLIPLD